MAPRWLWSLSPSIVLGMAFVVLTRFVRRTPATPRELSLDRSLTAHAPAGLIDLSQAVNVESWIVVVLVLTACLLLARRPRQALLLLLAEPLAEALNLSLKIAINRVMPGQEAVTGLDRLDVLLFPSGHVVRVTVTIGLLLVFVAWPHSRLRWPATIVALAFTGLLGVTQASVGGHLPLDVVGGFLLGAMLVNIMWVVDKAWTHGQPSSAVTQSLPALRSLVPRRLPRRWMPALSVIGLVCLALVISTISDGARQRLSHVMGDPHRDWTLALDAAAAHGIEPAHHLISRLHTWVTSA